MAAASVGVVGEPERVAAGPRWAAAMPGPMASSRSTSGEHVDRDPGVELHPSGRGAP